MNIAPADGTWDYDSRKAPSHVLQISDRKESLPVPPPLQFCLPGTQSSPSALGYILSTLFLSLAPAEYPCWDRSGARKSLFHICIEKQRSGKRESPSFHRFSSPFPLFCAFTECQVSVSSLTSLSGGGKTSRQLPPCWLPGK